MRRVFTAVLAAASLAAGLAALPAPAAAGDGRGYDHGYDRRADCRCDYSQRGYWERPGDRRRSWSRHSHRRYRDHHGPRYYPGYGYASGPSYRDGHHDRSDRSEWCARHYRSYDWRTGYYRGYDGRLRYCG